MYMYMTSLSFLNTERNSLDLKIREPWRTWYKKKAKVNRSNESLDYFVPSIYTFLWFAICSVDSHIPFSQVALSKSRERIAIWRNELCKSWKWIAIRGDEFNRNFLRLPGRARKHPSNVCTLPDVYISDMAAQVDRVVNLSKKSLYSKKICL